MFILHECKLSILTTEFINFLNMATTQSGAGGPASQSQCQSVSSGSQEPNWSWRHRVCVGVSLGTHRAPSYHHRWAGRGEWDNRLIAYCLVSQGSVTSGHGFANLQAGELLIFSYIWCVVTESDVLLFSQLIKSRAEFKGKRMKQLNIYSSCF